MNPVLSGIVEIEVHLAGVRVGEFPDLQVDDHQASQAAVEKEQVDSIPFVANAQAFLPANEAEVAAELKQKSLQVPDERLFQIGVSEYSSLRPIDLPVELPHRPATPQGFGFITAPGIFVFHRKQPDVGRPRKREAAGHELNLWQTHCFVFSKQCLEIHWAAWRVNAVKYSRRCLENVLVGHIKRSHLVEVAFGEAPTVSRCEIYRKPF
ncbi:MAG TPA: hypothetical protein VN300_07820 [Desulfobacterales bacterium]|nr:hypothetical protein [Desulfobacterales bacterium]